MRKGLSDFLKQFSIEKRVLKSIGKPVYPAPKALLAGGSTAGEARIVEEIDKAIDSLQKARKSVPDILAAQAKEIEAAWLSDKLSLVPGDLLLDGICQRFGVRFKKEIDSPRMAALIEPTEIDDEIRDLIHEIVA